MIVNDYEWYLEEERRWHGPFDDYEAARAAAMDVLKERIMDDLEQLNAMERERRRDRKVLREMRQRRTLPQPTSRPQTTRQPRLSDKRALSRIR